MTEATSITDMLIAWNEGDESALDRIIPRVERELRRIAAYRMRGEDQQHTLQTTALMNEAYLRLVDQNKINWKDRAHFFAIASRIMRRILLDYARGQDRLKRGGGALHIELDESVESREIDIDQLIDLDNALDKLAGFDQVKSRIVELRHFGGLSVEETAEVLDISPVTVARHWKLAKAWLRREMGDAEQNER